MSAVIGALIAHWTFWILLGIGWLRGELRLKGLTSFIALWLAGYVGSGFVLQGQLFAPYVAVLDVALVLLVFHGDVRLT